jgi:energy-coupling factor transporter ATP-binding protein EcfA2
VPQCCGCREQPTVAGGTLSTVRVTSIRATDLLSFRSFELDLHPGLNVVVGPNGSGKTNLVRLLALVRTALDVGAFVPGATIDLQRYVRIGAPAPQGTVSVGIELTEEREQHLLTGFLRSVVLSSITRTIEQTPSPDSPFEQELASKVRALVTEEQLAPLFTGRLALGLDASADPTFAFAYEFDYDGAAYHVGLAGSGMSAGWVAKGPMALSRRSSWGAQPLDLTELLTGGADGTGFALGQMLPMTGNFVDWQIKNHPSGQRLLFAEALATDLGLGPDPSRTLPFGLVLQRALVGALVLTANLRRPPRSRYELAEIGSPVALEDAGDLPLELYRRAMGDLAERQTYEDVRHLFRELTGQTFVPQLVGSPGVGGPPVFGLQPMSSPPSYQMQITPTVRVDTGEVPVDLSGAGVWEALVTCAAAVRVPGRVVVLDEPAANLHPNWQGRLLEHLATLDQTLLITHSPYLVPIRSVADLARTVRLHQGRAGTELARLPSALPDGWFDRWRQIVAGSTDSRAALFARGVVLLEGETDLGAFRYWFSLPAFADGSDQTANARNVLLLSVGGDKNFGAYVGYLQAFAIPWVIICDGPVLSPEREVSLISQLEGAGATLDPKPPAAAFEAWKAFWAEHGVFTVADRFGGVKDDHDKSGEIEAFFERTDAALWQEVSSRHQKSKTRAGFAFAEEIDLERHPEAREELQRLWSAVIEHLGV